MHLKSEKIMLSKIITVLILVFCSVFGKTDYCELEHVVCSKGTPHTGCKGTGLSPPSNENECKNKHIIEMTPELKSVLLREHNSWRNMLAGGYIKKFPPASRMLKMHWDEELAFLAEKHAEHCVFEHDNCRGTEKYPMSGQNIALKLYSHPFKDFDQMLKEMCAEWFEENELVPKSDVKTLLNNYHHRSDYGHFFVMAREKNDAIGCALVALENTVLHPQVPHHFMLTCNYAETNILSSSVYDQGESGSRCESFGSNYEPDSTDCIYMCKTDNDLTIMGNNMSKLILEKFKLCYKKTSSTSTILFVKKGLIVILPMAILMLCLKY